MKPVARPFLRPARRLRGSRRLQFIRRHATIAIAVETQDENARLLDEFLARDLAVLVFVEVAEIGLRQTGIGFLDRFEFLRGEKTLAALIGRGKQLLHELLPLIAGVDAVVIAVPYRRPVVEQRV